MSGKVIVDTVFGLVDTLCFQQYRSCIDEGEVVVTEQRGKDLETACLGLICSKNRSPPIYLEFLDIFHR